MSDQPTVTCELCGLSLPPSRARRHLSEMHGVFVTYPIWPENETDEPTTGKQVTG